MTGVGIYGGGWGAGTIGSTPPIIPPVVPTVPPDTNAPPVVPVPKKTNVFLIVGIITGVVILGVLIYFVSKK